MNRRDLLKALGVMGASLTVPQMMGRNAAAAISKRDLRNARAIIAGEINFVKPTTMPTVINIFLYGGPSELGGNLTNIDRINTDSQNKYTGVRGDILQPLTVVNGNANGQITQNGFWANAGGHIMEDLLATNQMSIIRTINRVVDDNKAHRESIFSAQTGGVATMESPGMGTVLAAMLRTKIPEYDSANSNMILPFVSFEGDTVLYDQGDINDLPLWLRSVSLDNGFNNPYRRQKLSAIAQNGTPSFRNCLVNGTLLDCNVALENLAAASGAGKFDRLTKSMVKRRELDAYFSSNALTAPVGKVPASVSGGSRATVTGVEQGNAQGNANFSGSLGEALRAAVVLALGNRDIPGATSADDIFGTRFITIGGGLGGWDDHDNSIQEYEQRMTGVMNNIRAALRLLNTGTETAGVTDNNARSDVVINMYGEFGRNVNLNGSMGWDHGNNMNLYTFGGHHVPGVSGIPGRALGQVVGTTKVIGTPGQNRLFTSPADGSVQWEPFSIAATVYRQFGVQNPEVLTKDLTIRGAENGFGSIPGLGGQVS